jgi:hypothetical protein
VFLYKSIEIDQEVKQEDVVYSIPRINLTIAIIPVKLVALNSST